MSHYVTTQHKLCFICPVALNILPRNTTAELIALFCLNEGSHFRVWSANEKEERKYSCLIFKLSQPLYNQVTSIVWTDDHKALQELNLTEVTQSAHLVLHLI